MRFIFREKPGSTDSALQFPSSKILNQPLLRTAQALSKVTELPGYSQHNTSLFSFLRSLPHKGQAIHLLPIDLRLRILVSEAEGLDKHDRKGLQAFQVLKAPPLHLLSNFTDKDGSTTDCHFVSVAALPRRSSYLLETHMKARNSRSPRSITRVDTE